MDVKKIISDQIGILKTTLNPQELALGEIIFNNGRCQVLAQSVSCFELIVADEQENEMAEYALDIEIGENEPENEYVIYPRREKKNLRPKIWKR